MHTCHVHTVLLQNGALWDERWVHYWIVQQFQYTCITFIRDMKINNISETRIRGLVNVHINCILANVVMQKNQFEVADFPWIIYSQTVN